MDTITPRRCTLYLLLLSLEACLLINVLLFNSYPLYDALLAHFHWGTKVASIKQSQQVYRHLLAYLQAWQSELTLAPFHASVAARHHFLEVRFLFVSNNSLALLLLWPSYQALRALYKARLFYYYKQYLRFVLYSLLGGGLLLSLAFPTIFILFHELIFKDQTWLFHLPEDNIILLLPPRFFQFYAFVFLLLLFIVLIFAYFLILNTERKTKHAKCKTHFRKNGT